MEREVVKKVAAASRVWWRVSMREVTLLVVGWEEAWRDQSQREISKRWISVLWRCCSIDTGVGCELAEFGEVRLMIEGEGSELTILLWDLR